MYTNVSCFRKQLKGLVLKVGCVQLQMLDLGKFQSC